MKEKIKCICKEELIIDKVYLHLAWCPESYYYKRDVVEFVKASWIKKLFLTDPRKYNNYWLKI